MRHSDSATHPAPAITSLDRALVLRLYSEMTLLRRFELSAQVLNRAGKLPGFLHLYIGEEATAVGVCAHLRPEDWITSTHRGHGHALAKGVPPNVLLAEIGGKASGCCGGRGGSMHLYDPPSGLFGTNGLVGGGIPSAVGAAISAKVRGTDLVTVAFFGDGAVNHGAFHESVNFATAQDAPVIFVCENNLYATATPLALATRNTDVSAKAAAYGLPGIAVDGNDVLAMWDATRVAVERARSGGGPTLIEARTYRVVGHHEGDPLFGSYRSKEEVELWKTRDPIAMLRTRLLSSGLSTGDELDAIEARVQERIAEAEAFWLAAAEPDPATVFDHVYAQPINPPMPPAAGPQSVVQGWLDAVRDGIAEEMRRDGHIIYMGEGIGERGGSFAHTKNLFQEFGGGRVIDTPISELGFTGAAVGAAATGCRAVADLMFADFLFEAASQIIHQAAKLRYTSNGRMRAPMIVRAGCGEVKTAGPHHSGSFHPMWAHIPGLIVCVPSNPADAKGLMKTALRAGDPVIFLEAKSLFASKGEVPVGEHLVPFGQAAIARAGTDLTVVSSGLLLRRCLEAAQALETQGVSCEVIDLRTIVPLDVDTIVASVARTGRVLVVDEGYAMCGVGGEIAAAIGEAAFDELDAPVGRLHTLAVTHPVNAGLERETVVTVDKIVAAARAVMAGTPVAPRRHLAAATPTVAAPVAADIAASAPGPAPASAAVVPAAVARIAGIPVSMPHGDLTVTEGTVKAWFKKVGDVVKAGDVLVEVETEKSVSEIEAPSAGVLAEILAPAGTVVTLGQQLATLGQLKAAHG
ncbi:MAG: dehydrogenase [Planctomycetes bacterium]|nr:dehydrogenase [Planctomycetota bacterium]